MRALIRLRYIRQSTLYAEFKFKVDEMKQVAIVMGSQSDGPTMKHAADMLKKFGIEYHAEVVSAHRTPHLLQEFAETAEEKGYKVIIAGAGLSLIHI